MQENFKIGIDIGNSGIKAAGKLEGQYIQHTVKSLVATNSTDTYEIVEMKDSHTPLYFGVGLSLVTQNKSERIYLEETIFLAIAKVYGKEANGNHVQVGIGLPLEDFKNEHLKNAFKEKVSKIKKLEGKYNGEPYVFDVKIHVFAEGFSAFYYLMPELDKKYRWVISDHGYRTTDVLLVSYENGKWRIENHATIYKGLIEMYEAIAKGFAKETEEPIYLPEQVEFGIINSTPIVLRKPIKKDDKIISEACFKDYVRYALPVVKHIYDTLGVKFSGAMDGRKIMLVGGGSEIVEPLLDRSSKVMDDEFEKRAYANAIGFYLQIK